MTSFSFRITSILTAAVLCVSTHLFAKVSTEITPQSIGDQEIKLLRQNVQDQRRQLVAANIPLTTEESAKFWPIYDQYIAEVAKINDARYERIKWYAANYTTMTDQEATDYIGKVFATDKAMIDLRQKYQSNFEKALSKKKAAMFVQMDRRVQMMIDLQLASKIPLINPNS
jgi:hypothetical protein